MLLESTFKDFPPGARVLGAGTGTEFAHLARTFPAWRFTVVEPSKSMLDVCRRRPPQKD